MAPKILGLKIGCKVLLLKNLNNLLVNDLRGNVVKLNDDSVGVVFNVSKKDITVNIKREIFTSFDPIDKRILAKRVQMPLKLAYAMTVHKAQGMSLQKVVVNYENCFQPGQIGVAVGRATSEVGLRLLNFKKHLVKPHSNFVNIKYVL